MSDDTIRLVTIGRIFRRRWRLLTALALVGALAGYGASVLFPPHYVTTAQVLAPGSWDEREMLTQTQVATSSVVIDRAAAKLHWSGVGGADLRKQVSAKATQSNIIKISGKAGTPERAKQLADRAAKELVAYTEQVAAGDGSGAAGPAALRKKVVETNRRISELSRATDPGRAVESVQTRTELERLRSALEGAMTKLEESDPAAMKGTLTVMGPAARPTGEAPPTRVQLIIAGALLFFLFAVVGHVTAARMSRRARTGAEIAGALGSRLLGTVDVPAAQVPSVRGPRRRIQRLLGTDTRWDVPAPRASLNEASRRIRFRRVCERLRDEAPAPQRLLVVVPEGDDIAHRAAAQLVAEAKGAPLLRLWEVSVAQPLVPDRGTESGAVVVLSAGSWTTAELAGIAGACADGRHEVVGAVVAAPVRAGAARPSGRAPNDATMELAVPPSVTGGKA